MLVSHRKKFIYTKTIKTAGTSVESYFEKYCMAVGDWEFAHQRDEYVSDAGIIGYRGADSRNSTWYNHMSASEIREKIGIQIWDSYFKFCVIRNPFDKLVSQFFFRLDKGLIVFEDVEDPILGFRQWISKGVPVLDRTLYVMNNEICVDYLIRYEDIETGIKFVCDKLQIQFEAEKIPVLKSGIRDRSIPLSRFYTAKIAQSVAKAYAFEIRKFGFRLP